MEQNKRRVVLPKPDLVQTSPDSTSMRPRPSATKPNRPTKKRRNQFPGWAKPLVIVGLIFGSLLFGMIIGYSIVGKGPVGDVFSFSTWKHILDLIIG